MALSKELSSIILRNLYKLGFIIFLLTLPVIYGFSVIIPMLVGVGSIILGVIGLSLIILSALVLFGLLFKFLTRYDREQQLPLLSPVASINRAINLNQILRYIASSIIVFGLFVTLALSAPIALPISLPLILMACGICTFVSVPIFLRTAIYYEKSIKAIIFNLLLTGVIFGLFVTLAIFTPIALSCSLPFILAASGLLAIAFSRLFCNNFIGNNSDTPPSKQYIASPGRWLIVTGLIFGLFVALGMSIPIAIPMALPFILAASSLLAIAFSRIFCSHIITSPRADSYLFMITTRTIFVALFFFTPLVVIGFFAPITIPLSPLFILTASGLGSLALSRIFFNSLSLEGLKGKEYLLILATSTIGLILFSGITAGILAATSLPLSLPFILAVGIIGMIVTFTLEKHIYKAYTYSKNPKDHDSANETFSPQKESKGIEDITCEYCPFCHPINHSFDMIAETIKAEGKTLLFNPPTLQREEHQETLKIE